MQHVSRIPGLRSCVAIAAMLVCSLANAGGPALVITDKGYSIMTAGADGTPVVTPITQVVDLRGGTTPVPIPPVDTPPPVNTTATRVKELAKKIGDPLGSEVLAGALKMLAENGGIRPADLEGNRNIFNSVFGITLVTLEKESPGARQRWQPFRDEFAGLLNELRSKGELGTQAQCDKFLDDTQQGLASAGGNTLLPTEILQLIRDLLPLILELIRTFRGG